VDFFKNNYWFSKTNRKMLDSMANHSVKIRNIMDRLGQDKVENFIDHCLAIENLIDPYLQFSNPKRRESKTEDEEAVAGEPGRLKTNRQYMDQYINPPAFLEEQKKKMEVQARKSKKNPPEPQKDILAFLLDNAPLEQWEHEVLSIVRDEAYYFAPQAQTKIMNEGWASYWHSKIMTQKALKDSEVVDFSDHHAGTMAMQPGRINPYKVGIELFRDIRSSEDFRSSSSL
jgi:stage V sporulation protein R